MKEVPLYHQMNVVKNKTISKWGTGKCMPDYSIVRSLCEELDITLAELMDGEKAEKYVIYKNSFLMLIGVL